VADLVGLGFRGDRLESRHVGMWVEDTGICSWFGEKVDADLKQLTEVLAFVVAS
jgi:hypothetical protein